MLRRTLRNKWSAERIHETTGVTDILEMTNPWCEEEIDGLQKLHNGNQTKKEMGWTKED